MVTLTSLGLEAAGLVPQGDKSEPSWITGRLFLPAVGSCYEVHFGRIVYRGNEAYVSARLRIEGSTPAAWIDLDDQQPLDPELSRFAVQAFRMIVDAQCAQKP